MRDWIIKLLGGFTATELKAQEFLHSKLVKALGEQIDDLRTQRDITMSREQLLLQMQTKKDDTKLQPLNSRKPWLQVKHQKESFDREKYWREKDQNADKVS